MGAKYMTETQKPTSGHSSSTSTSSSSNTTTTTLSTSPTGSHDFLERKYVNSTFGKYEIMVELTLDDKFLGITQVKLNKDFRTFSQKISRKTVHDVEEYYKDE